MRQYRYGELFAIVVLAALRQRASPVRRTGPALDAARRMASDRMEDEE